VNPLDGSAGVRGSRTVDFALLDDTAAMEAADPGQMLRATASAGAQVRESAALAQEADFKALADEGRPRAVVVAGVGTAARTGDVLATVAGPRCPVPVLSHRSAGVPGWVGAADVVIAVSASGRSPEALAAADAAARRGARLVAIGAPDSELQGVAERARAIFIPVPRRYPARVSFWALAVPVLAAGRALGLVKVNEADLAETATRLDTDAERCRPGLESFVNPGKALALDLANSIPVVWGTSPLATVAARRFADTLAANARYPAVAGSLGEAGRGRVGLLEGVYGALSEAERDIFADPDDEGSGQDRTRLRLVLLRDGGLRDTDLGGDGPGADDDADESASVEERRADAVQRIAEQRGVRISLVEAEGASALERLASMIAVPDFASIYLGLAHGLDPMAVPAISELKDLTNP
jgi:D-arabinose 5-phosphate isomerase GutQ